MVMHKSSCPHGLKGTWVDQYCAFWIYTPIVPKGVENNLKHFQYKVLPNFHLHARIEDRIKLWLVSFSDVHRSTLQEWSSRGIESQSASYSCHHLVMYTQSSAGIDDKLNTLMHAVTVGVHITLFWYSEVNASDIYGSGTDAVIIGRDIDQSCVSFLCTHN